MDLTIIKDAPWNSYWPQHSSTLVYLGILVSNFRFTFFNDSVVWLSWYFSKAVIGSGRVSSGHGCLSPDPNLTWRELSFNSSPRVNSSLPVAALPHFPTRTEEARDKRHENKLSGQPEGQLDLTCSFLNLGSSGNLTWNFSLSGEGGLLCFLIRLWKVNTMRVQ